MTLKSLPNNLKIADLYDHGWLHSLDQFFLLSLQEHNEEEAEQLKKLRQDPESFSKKDTSQALVRLSIFLEEFLVDFFNLHDEIDIIRQGHQEWEHVFDIKRQFIQKRASTYCKPEETENLPIREIENFLMRQMGHPFDEKILAGHIKIWLEGPACYQQEIEAALQYAAWALHSKEGKRRHRDGVLFKLPKKRNFSHLVNVKTETMPYGEVLTPFEDTYKRDGFHLTDPGFSRVKALSEAYYCIYCHNQEKDSCSRGYRDKKTDEFALDPFNHTLTGCPLEEKISEMHSVKIKGFNIAALALITVDNPMVAATGHRICNDCMKACIYQKQDPVNIPAVETQILKEVLSLPWGFEIYSLLTRWNPLNFARPLPKPPSGYKVLVAGMGPAGFTLAHHLLNEGHTVVAVDGLKIEPLPKEWASRNLDGSFAPLHPIYDIDALYESLDQRILWGFGGVMEYGVTVRWDKNLLKVVRLLLERRQSFALFDGVRLGSSLTLDQAFEDGFDHIALCLGSGRPSLVSIPNNLARGVRHASDFLMSLQLTGAARNDSVANLQIRLPLVVIGGGLTAIDTATEAAAYYVRQVEKFKRRYEVLCAHYGIFHVEKEWTEEEKEIAYEYLSHAQAINVERQNAIKEKRSVCFAKLLQSWGGVTVAYRRSLQEAPSYRLNHEELDKAFEEGIHFLEHFTPTCIDIDKYHHTQALQGYHTLTKKSFTIPARTILFATGTQPNTVIAAESPLSFKFQGAYFSPLNLDGKHITPASIAKPKELANYGHIRKDGRVVSFFGDLHPSFAGNVVKAMASAKQGYPLVTQALAQRAPTSITGDELTAQYYKEYKAVVHNVRRLTSNIFEVVIKAPRAAKAFRPGQFFRLQNYETYALRTDDTVLSMETLAMTGAYADPVAGLVSIIVLGTGGSSTLCQYLKPGEPVVLMGPTGTPTEIPSGKTVLLIGGGLGNAVLFSIGKALKLQGNKVIYVAGYKSANDLFKQQDIEIASDVAIWCSDNAPLIQARRLQDLSYQGNVVEVITHLWENHWGDLGNKLDHMIVIGSDRMMAAVAKARQTIWKPYLPQALTTVASINSPMQCMMKEICGQCLQRHVDPVTGKEKVVFSCVNQDQDLEQVDFYSLSERLKQNSLQEKLSALWVRHTLSKILNKFESNTVSD